MLFRLILSPSVFREIPQSEETQKYFFACLFSLFNDIEQNCVILVDQDKKLVQAFKSCLGNWPVKYKTKAQQFLKQLGKTRRIVGFDSTCHKSSDLEESCQYCLGIATKVGNIPILTSESCCFLVKDSLKTDSFETVKISEYSTSGSTFFKDRRNGLSKVIDNNKWDFEKLEYEVFVPLFRYAKHITLYDRWIGRSVFENEPRGFIQENYKRTLDRLIKIFAQFAKSDTERTFEIITTTRINNMDLEQIRKPFLGYSEEIKNKFSKCNLNFSIRVKKETFQNKFNHSRYLITDQGVGVLIERGFDLLIDKRRVRDVSIALIWERERIQTVETSIKRLKDWFIA